MKTKLFVIFCTVSAVLQAQDGQLQYFRPNNKTGLNIFETSKNDTTAFTGQKVRIGGNFTQDFQGLSQHNAATPVMVAGVNTNQLPKLTNGFTLAMANLNIDAQLADGIRLNMTMYLSSRHHNDAWVKGGYVQFDKLLFLKSDFVDNLMKNITIKVGDYGVDYGDQHFRRTDGGSTIYNPFVENYIMDEFTTEVGGEIYYHHKSGLIAMLGVTNGQINPTVLASTKIDSATGKMNRYVPAYHGKLGYDKQFNKDLRFRITGSFYMNKSNSNITLFGGDRTGSHYFYAMENTAATATANAFSGRLNPSFSQQVSTFMINPFVKFKGLELFGTYEIAKGRTIIEANMRTATQYAVDLIYRFPQDKENFWIGGRYNSVTAAISTNPNNITINRLVGSVGWFITKNMALKTEYVSQLYQDFKPTDIRSGGKFNALMIEATIGF